MPNKSSRKTDTDEPRTMTVDADSYDASKGNPAAQPSDDPAVPQPTPAPEVDSDIDPDAKTVAPESQADYYSTTTGSDQG